MARRSLLSVMPPKETKIHGAPFLFCRLCDDAYEILFSHPKVLFITPILPPPSSPSPLFTYFVISLHLFPLLHSLSL